MRERQRESLLKEGTRGGEVGEGEGGRRDWRRQISFMSTWRSVNRREDGPLRR